MIKVNKGSVVQFNENHKWCGCIGIINEIRELGSGVRYMIGVPVPDSGTAFIFVMDYENALEYIGEAQLLFREEEENDDES